ncbi:MAG TPA: hypothetical protein VGC99_03975 [Candidatus Tectomicrobia bacterium]
MSKVGKSLLRGAREALDYTRGVRDGFVRHVPHRQALFVEELADDELEAISRAEVPPEHDHLDLESED